MQLPDFQREWVWDDDHVKSLLASVSLSYPIGAIMMLQADPDDMTFRRTPLEGVEAGRRPGPPENLVLDGQQRLTSLFLALRSGMVVTTQGCSQERDQALVLHRHRQGPEPERGPRRGHLRGAGRPHREATSAARRWPTTRRREKEFEAEVFPLAQILESSDWQQQPTQVLGATNKEHMRALHGVRRGGRSSASSSTRCRPSCCVKETPKEAVCQVFEKVNTGGVSLTGVRAADGDLRREQLQAARRLARAREAGYAADLLCARIGDGHGLHAVHHAAGHESPSGGRRRRPARTQAELARHQLQAARTCSSLKLAGLPALG